MSKRIKNTRGVSRSQLRSAHFPSAAIGYAVMDMLDELFEAGPLTVETLQLSGCWDKTTDALVLHARMDV